MSVYQRFHDTQPDDTQDGRCCLAWRRWRLRRDHQTLASATQDSALVTHDMLQKKAVELNMMREGVRYEITELSLEAMRHLKEDPPDKDMARSCLERRWVKQKRYRVLVQQYTNARIFCDKLTEAATCQRFTRALQSTNVTLDHVLRNIDLDGIEGLLDRLDDQQSDVEELQTLLAREPSAPSADVAFDVEEELRILAQEDALLRTADLPDVPGIIGPTRVENNGPLEQEENHERARDAPGQAVPASGRHQPWRERATVPAQTKMH